MREKVRSLVEEKVSERVAGDRRSNISDQSTMSDHRDYGSVYEAARVMM